MQTSDNAARHILSTRRFPILCYVTDRRQLGIKDPDAFLSQSLRWGVDIVQLREKDLPDRTLLKWARNLVVNRRGRWPLLMVNTRFDIALASQADGVHLPSRSVPIPDIRRCIGEECLIGKSVHSLEQSRQAADQGADYLFFGPVFDTPLKRNFGSPQGVQRLAEVSAEVSIPVFAIGGIDSCNAGLTLRHGACGIAAIRWFQQSKDPSSAVRLLRSALANQTFPK